MNNSNENIDLNYISIPLSNGNYIIYNSIDKLFYFSKPFKINELKEIMEKNGYGKDYNKTNDIILKIENMIENQKKDLKKFIIDILKPKEKKKESDDKKDEKKLINNEKIKNQSNNIILIKDDDEEKNDKKSEKDKLINIKRKRDSGKDKITSQKTITKDPLIKSNNKSNIENKINNKNNNNNKNKNINININNNLTEKKENEKNLSLDNKDLKNDNDKTISKNPIKENNKKTLSSLDFQTKTPFSKSGSNNSIFQINSKKVIYTYTDILTCPEPEFEELITINNVEIGDSKVVFKFLSNLKFTPIYILEEIRKNYPKLNINIDSGVKVITYKKRESFNYVNIIIESLKIKEYVKNNKKKIALNICANKVLAKLFKDKIKKYIDLEKYFEEKQKSKNFLQIIGYNKDKYN